MDSPALPFVGAADVERLLDTPSLMEALRAAFLDPPEAPARAALPIARTPVSGPGTLLVMPAVRPGGLAVVKLVTVHPELGARAGGALRSVLLALDATTGETRGLVDGHSLTLRRTAAASVLAARALADPESRALLVVGAGAVAGALARAYAAAFALERVSVWARRPEAAAELAAELAADGLPAAAAGDLDRAVGEADIVSAATLAETPLIRGAAVRPGAHVDLVGGFRPTLREADDALIARADVVADTSAAWTEAGDLAQPIASGVLDPARVRLLADVLRAPAAPRARRAVTLFKSVGCALEDLAAAELLFARLAEEAA